MKSEDDYFRSISAAEWDEKVDFIKCDVEGAECSIWDDKEFFNKFRPKIVIEPHLIDGKMTTDDCVSQLKNYGYECKFFETVECRTFDLQSRDFPRAFFNASIKLG